MKRTILLALLLLMPGCAVRNYRDQTTQRMQIVLASDLSAEEKLKLTEEVIRREESQASNIMQVIQWVLTGVVGYMGARAGR